MKKNAVTILSCQLEEKLIGNPTNLHDSSIWTTDNEFNVYIEDIKTTLMISLETITTNMSIDVSGNQECIACSKRFVYVKLLHIDESYQGKHIGLAVMYAIQRYADYMGLDIHVHPVTMAEDETTNKMKELLVKLGYKVNKETEYAYYRQTSKFKKIGDAITWAGSVVEQNTQKIIQK